MRWGSLMASRNRANGNGGPLGGGRDRMTMLDRALEGASAEERARVRGVLLRYGIDEDNEFFMIFVAIGHLLVLVEEAPENWRSLFDDVHLELKQWSQENFKSLESIQQHAQTSADLITVLRRLLNSMQHSDNRSSETLSTLQSLKSKLTDIDTHSDLTLANSQKTLSQLSSLESLTQSSSSQLKTLVEHENQRDWISSASLVLVGLTLGSLMVSHWTMARRFDTQELLIWRQSERISWLLEKANRQECLTGIKPMNHPQCRQYQ
jgi:hypothetical protein